MESKPRKLKKRRVKKPKTFKRKLKSFVKKQFGANWKIIILTPPLMGIIILAVLFWVVHLPDRTSTPMDINANVTPENANYIRK
jgi:hypothetical protein